MDTGTAEPMSTAAKPTIHILGGGPSGLSAAFHLTSPTYNPNWSTTYNVVVHQLGWRLGGKGATGRNADAGNRVEEHGIHLFGNMYANSLHMLYAALCGDGPTPPVDPMPAQFEPSDFQLGNDFFDGTWHGFQGWLPYDGDKPWLISSEVGSFSDILTGALNTAKGIFKTLEMPPPVPTPATAPHRPVPGPPSAQPATPQPATPQTPAPGWSPISIFEAMLNSLQTALEHEAAAEPRGSDSYDRLRWEFVQIDLITACIRGALAADVWQNGIDSLDGVPYRDWLITYGLHEMTMSSGLLQAIPNTCMQYPDGDATGFPQMSAAAYLTFVLRQLVAPGSSAYFFRVSTGETVILPLYQRLLARGVQFDFFSKIVNLVPSTDGTKVATIQRIRQAHVIGSPAATYEPLRTLPGGQQVWPNQPLYEQLVEGARLQQGNIDLESWWADWPGTREDIQLGSGDAVIVALPPAAQAIVCAQAAAAAKDPDKRWQNMLTKVQTSATQALQIWLDKPTSALGWPDLSVTAPNQSTTNRWLGATFANPLSAFADFSRTLASETWPINAAPQGLIYFCGPLQDEDPVPDFDDHEFPTRQKARVGAGATQFLRQLGGLLPNAADASSHVADKGIVADVNSLDFSLLHCYHDDAATTGENRVQQQYFRANIDPNERYTVSAPGTLQYRPSPWQSGYANVILSSDAVFTGFNIGSFEGAVMSGMLASYAATGSPKTSAIYGYGFCRPNPPSNATPLFG